jgi:hypothetical protein
MEKSSFEDVVYVVVEPAAVIPINGVGRLIAFRARRSRS